MKSGSQYSRLMASLAAGALLAAMPLTIQPSPAGPSLGATYAHAKDGGDDRGGDDRGGNSGRGGSDDRGGDDHGGSSGRGGSDDHGGSDDRGGDDHGGSDDRGGDDRSGGDDHGGNSGRDDRGGDDRGGDDRGGDDRSGRRGGDDSGSGRGDDDGRAAGGKVEITPTGIEVVHADGSKEEVRNGRYERKDATGRTVEERPATARDFTRLSNASSPPASGRTIRVGFVTKVEGSGGNLEVLYSTGWKEELEDGRYELKDPNNNTVVERPARQSDIARLQQIAGR